MNVCSLLPKIDLVELELSNNDIILLSETHLNDDIVDGDIQIKGYQCPIRKNRNRQGGGIAIYTKHHIYVVDLKDCLVQGYVLYSPSSE
jgi:exonuclease III